jgi:membrane fusion protein, multidrug efflux system
MGGGNAGDSEPGESDSTNTKNAGDGQPPRHVPERRGTVQGPGGRRANDRRVEEDKDDDKDKDKDGGKDEDDGKEKNGKDEEDEGGDGDNKDKASVLKKRWVRIAIAIVGLMVLIALVWWLIDYLTHGRYVQSTNDAYVRADKVAVTSTVAAKVVRIDIVDNQYVKAGDLLVELDTRATDAKVEQYVAQGAQARAVADQYRMQMVAQQATVAQSAAQARGAEVQRDYYAGEAKRYAPLVSAGAEREEQLAQFLQERDKAEQNVLQYRASELSARRQIPVLQTQVAQADAQARQAAAQEAQSAVDVGNSKIRAAVDGRVGDRQIFLGTYVNAGTQMLTIIPIAGLYVEANFKETQLGLMRIGQPVTISVDALDGTKIAGTIESFSPATGSEFSALPPQNATGNFTKIVQRVPVRIRLDAGPEARRVLVAGLSVIVDVDTVGNKDDVDRRKQEEKGRENRVKQQSDADVNRDRERREPGAGR